MRALVELARRGEEGYMSIRKIAEEQEISLKYLEQILPVLRDAGIVQAASGRGGGYKLGVAPEDCKVGQVLRLLEGDLAPVSCLACGARPCSRADICATLPIWREYDRITKEYFDGISLADLSGRG